MTAQTSAQSCAAHDTLQTTVVAFPKRPTNRSVLARLANRISVLWFALERTYNEMRSRSALEKMVDLDDAMLRDMGVTRADIRRAVRLPLHTSAAAQLARESRRSRSITDI